MSTASGDQYRIHIGGDAAGPVVVGRDNHVEVDHAPTTAPTPTPAPASTPARLTASRIAMAPSCGAVNDAKDPRYLPIGVRVAETMTIGSLLGISNPPLPSRRYAALDYS